MLTSEDKREIQNMIQAANSRSLRQEIIALIPEIFGRSAVQLKNFFVKEII